MAVCMIRQLQKRVQRTNITEPKNVVCWGIGHEWASSADQHKQATLSTQHLMFTQGQKTRPNAYGTRDTTDQELSGVRVTDLQRYQSLPAAPYPVHHAVAHQVPPCEEPCQPTAIVSDNGDNCPVDWPVECSG